MNSFRFALAFVLALGVMVAPFAKARATNRQEARAAFKKGRMLFKKGNYAEAVVALKRAYSLSPHPALLRYLGQTYYKWSKPKEAIAQFERYLKEAPQAPDRAQIEARIAEIKEIVTDSGQGAESSAGGQNKGEGKKAAKEPKVDLRPTGEDNEMPDIFKGHRATAPGGKANRGGGDGGRAFWTLAKWTSVGLAAAGLAMGITFNLMASSKASDLEAAVTASNPEKNKPTVSYNASHFDMQQAYKRDNVVAIISYVAGGVFAAAAVTLFVVSGDDASAEKQAAARSGAHVALAPALGPGYYGLAGSVRF